MSKYLFILLMTGCLVTAVTACTDATSAPDTGAAVPAPEEPNGNSDSMAGLERSDYNEVPLPQDATLVGADPEQIALAVFGNREPVEGNFQEEVVLTEQTTDQSLVTLTQTGLPDDSVEGVRYLLEFMPEGEQWRLNWAGRQVRCYPDRGSQAWTTANCD